MLANLLPPFLGTYSLSMSSLGYIVMSFLVLWSICWSSSLVPFKNDPEYLTRGETAQVSILLMRFLFYSLVYSSFLVPLRCSFLIFFISACLMVSAFQYLLVSFFPSVLISSWFGISIPSILYHFRFSILACTFFWGKFHPSILTVNSHNLYQGFISFSFLANSCMSMYIR